LKEGDHNTSFFHRLANSHRMNNFISSLSIDGSDTSNQEVINGSIIQYDSNLFTETTLWPPKLDGLEFPLLDAREVDWLERPFREEEVHQALLNMDCNKASRLDGFTIAFFQSCWVIVKDDLMRVFHNFHEHDLFEKSLNTTFIALVPKEIGKLEVSDFKSISLVGNVYKILEPKFS
jgi:hypothetical protein